MASWVPGNDGLLRGYMGAYKTLRPEAFHFASPGSVDINGVTRLQYNLPGFTGGVNRLRAEVPFTFTATDMTNNAGKKVTLMMYLAPSSAFADGAVPTPTQIVNAAGVRLYRADWYYTSIAGSVTRTFNIDGPAPGTLASNTKYWVLIAPVYFTNANDPWDTSHFKPLKGVTLNTIGRALSVWSNRTPEAPTITAPVTGLVVNPGDVVTLVIDTPPAGNTSDRAAPDDAERVNRDIAGVEYSYAELPTAENPTPTWRYFAYTLANGALQVNSHALVGSTDTEAQDGRKDLIEDLGMKILCGSDELVALHANLPAGAWQIRARTADYGHPYPTLVSPPNGTAGWDMTNYPALNKSPWSAPIRINILAQVPPPIALSPKDNLAVAEDTTIRLNWKYRNTFLPPFDQAERVIQIRKVGDPDWTTVFSGPSALSYVDLPPVLDNGLNPVSPEQYLTDLGFESGTLGGWSAYDPFELCDGSESVSNQNLVAFAHSGTHLLRMDYAGSGWPGFTQTVDLDPLHDTFQFSGWVHPVDDATTVSAGIIWQDGAGVNLPDEVQPTPWETTKAVGVPWPGVDGWLNIDTGVLPKPIGAEKAQLVVQIYDLVGFDMTGFGGSRLDDVSFQGWQTYPLGDFTLEATTWYEWQVAVRDEDNEWSNFSTPARFWIVSAPVSGNERPVPNETIEGATLGCGTHRIEIFRQGGTRPVGEITGVSKVDWGRVRDDISTAQVEVSDWSIDCGNLLASLQCWAYEVVIFRDNGYSVDRVWEGPITLLTYEESKVTIQAKDVVGYLYRRILKQQMNDSGTGNGRTVVARATQVIQNALAPHDPNLLGYLTPINQDDDAMQYRSTPAYSRTAFEEVDDMAANAGLDYTAVGRAILLWGTKHRIGTLPEFRDKDLGAPPIVSEYGMSMANRYVVSDGNGVWGEANRLNEDGQDPTYGLVEMLSSTWASDSTEDSGTYTQEGLQTVIESFEGYAERSIADRYPPPVVVRVPDNTSLSPDVAISIQQLVPGVVIPLRSHTTLRTVVQNQKLDSVKVVEEGGKETITVTMSPFSRDDNAVGEEVEA